RLKGSTAGKDYIGPAGRTPGKDDREILSFDGRVMILKYVDPEVDGRYGTGIFVRCAPRAPQANAATSRRIAEPRRAPALAQPKRHTTPRRRAQRKDTPS